jgi:glutathione S-transferase
MVCENTGATKVNHMIRLYGAKRSRAARCVWMLEETGQPYEHLELTELDQAGRAATLKRLNPIGKSPSSSAGTLPIGDQSLAVAWSIWAMTEMEPPLGDLFAERCLKPKEQRDAEIEARSLERLVRPMNALETHLEGRAWLLGDTFTVADLNLASVLTLMNVTGYDLDNYPEVARWRNACYQRPAHQRSRPA